MYKTAATSIETCCEASALFFAFRQKNAYCWKFDWVVLLCILFVWFNNSLLKINKYLKCLLTLFVKVSGKLEKKSAVCKSNHGNQKTNNVMTMTYRINTFLNKNLQKFTNLNGNFHLIFSSNSSRQTSAGRAKVSGPRSIF